ncbi:MAG: hypothetical protein HEQ23_03290 [Tepidisphaera sp.]
MEQPVGGTWHVASNWLSNNIPDTVGESAALVNLSTPYAVNLTTGVTIGDFLGVSGTTLNINNTAALNIAGASFSNQGVVVVNANGGGNATFINFTGGATLSGAGAIRLNGTSGVLDRAYLTSNGGFSNGGGHTIRGRGNIYNAMTNNGFIVADETGEVLQTLSGAKVNNNFMRATNGAILQISGGSINQSGGGVIQADGGTVNLIAGTNIISGTMSALNGGVINVTGGSATLNGVALTGPMTVQNNNTLSLPTGIANNGTITVNSNAGGSLTNLSFADGQAITGTGEIVLNATSNVLDRAYISSPNGPSGVTNSLGHTIRGRGNVYYRLNNGGTVRSDSAGDTLQMRDGVITNSGTIEASDGGNLALTSATVNQTPGGLIRATGGGNVVLTNVSVAGGTMNATLPSRIIGASGTQTLSTVTVNGPLDVQNNTSLVVAGSLTHTGTLTVNSTAGGNATSLRPTSGATFSGSGEILLNATSNVLDRAQLYAPPGSAGFINAAGHLIRGSGNIYYNSTNNGTIRSGLTGQILQFTGGTTTNSGLIEAVAGDVYFTSHTVNQTAGGQVTAGVGGNIVLSTAILRNGTALASGGGRIVAAAGANTVDAINVLGPLDIVNGSSVAVPTGLSNQSTITVNSNGGGSVTSIQPASGAVFSGNGTIAMNATSNVLDRAQLYAPNGTAGFTNGSSHTISGSGAIYYNFVNDGTVRANLTGRTLLLTSGTVTNNALIEAVAGDIALSTRTVAQSANGRVIASGGNVVLTSSTIQGGTVSGLGGSRVASVSGVNTLSGATIIGRFDVDNNTQLSVSGNVLNNGVLTVNANSGGSATIISFANGTTLGGMGRTVLNATLGVLDRAYLFVPSGSATNAAGHTVAGTGNIYGNITNRGILSPGNNTVGMLAQATGTYTQAAEGSLDIELGGTAAGQSDMVGGAGAKVLGGTLNLSYRPGFQLGQCQTITIMTGSSITGRFATVNTPPVELGFISVIYNPTSVVISYVPSDYNGDGFPDFFDYDDYVNCFETGNCPEGTSADFNRDGFVDFFDYDAFVQAFESGC